MLAWSEVRNLYRRLNQFLGESRLERDLNEARMNAREAYRLAEATLRTVYKDTTGVAPEGDIAGEAQLFVSQQKTRFKEQMRQSARRVSLDFEASYKAIIDDKVGCVAAVRAELLRVLGSIGNRTDAEIASSDFLDTLLPVEKDDFGTKYQINGKREALQRIRAKFMEMLEDESGAVSQALMSRFQDVLHRKRIDDALNALSYQQDYAHELLDTYNGGNASIMARLGQNVSMRCREGTMSTASAYNAVANVVKNWPNFGYQEVLDTSSTNPMSASSQVNVALSDATLIEKYSAQTIVQAQFAHVRTNLLGDMPERLYIRFIKALKDTVQEVEQLVEDVCEKHEEHLYDHASSLYKALEKAYGGKEAQVRYIGNLWTELHKIKI